MRSVFFLFLFSLTAQAADLPPRARALMNLKTIESGPNCWNSALYVAGLVNGIRFVNYDEFTAWLSSPFCEEVGEAEAREGDIVALRRVGPNGKLLRSPFGSEIHGYYLAGNGIAFTKNGLTRSEGYHLQDIQSLFDDYEAKDRQNCRILGFPRGVCHLKAQYFRCKPSPVWASELTVLAGRISSLEHELRLFYLGKSGTDPEEEKSLTESRAEALRKQAAEIGKSLPQNLKWQLDLLEMRLEGITTFYF